MTDISYVRSAESLYVALLDYWGTVPGNAF
jgi:hypothetical protein